VFILSLFALLDGAFCRSVEYVELFESCMLSLL
jgi:hypothetical protein